MRLSLCFVFLLNSMTGFAQLTTGNGNTTSDCDNVTDGGGIMEYEEHCGWYDPDPILEYIPASGGTGELEYVWLYNYQPLPLEAGINGWTQIPNSNTPNYDPGPIVETMYFTRVVRRSGCIQYQGVSNLIGKVVYSNSMTVHSATAPAVICNDQPAQLIASTAEHYVWNTGQYGQTVLVQDTGYYWVANQCDTSDWFYVGEAELEPPVIEQTSECSFRVINFTDSLNYQWYLDGEPIGGSTAQFNSDSLNGTYTVKARSSNGCLVESNGLSCYNNTSIDEMEIRPFEIYPNPTSYLLNVRLLAPHTINSFRIYSIQGRTILSGKQLLNNTIDVSSIPNGIYFLELINEHAIRFSLKFSKTDF